VFFEEVGLAFFLEKKPRVLVNPDSRPRRIGFSEGRNRVNFLHWIRPIADPFFVFVVDSIH